MNTDATRRSPDLSVVVVSYNTRDLLRRCLAGALAEADLLDLEVIVVDNASSDGSAAMVANEFPRVRLVASGENLGFAAANNLAFGLCRGRHVLMLNPDAVARRGALVRAVQRLDASPRVAAAGARILGPDGSLQPSARRFPSLLDEALTLTGLAARYPRSRFFGRFDRTWADPLQEAPVDWVPGAFLIVKREVLDEVGRFDEAFFLYYEEVDLCRRIRAAGHEIRYWPDLVVEHIGGASSKTQDSMAVSRKGTQLTLWRMRSALLYWRKHHGAVTAWAAATLESAFHRLRAQRHAGAADADRRQRHEESARQVALMARAWADTGGGRVSPSRPW